MFKEKMIKSIKSAGYFAVVLIRKDGRLLACKVYESWEEWVKDEEDNILSNHLCDGGTKIYLEFLTRREFYEMLKDEFLVSDNLYHRCINTNTYFQLKPNTNKQVKEVFDICIL